MQRIVMVVLVIAILVGAVALYLLFAPLTQTPSMLAQNGTDVISAPEGTTTAEPISGVGSLMALAARGVPLECRITFLDKATTLSGTYFVNGDRMRGDFVTNDQAAGEIVSSMIVTSDTLYTWSVIDGASYGMRADRAAMMATQGVNEAPDTREPVPLDQDVTYDCTPWTRVDGSIFEPPADVLFQDYSTLMKMGMEFSNTYEAEAAASDTEQSCAMCAQIPDAAAKSECMRTFACR